MIFENLRPQRPGLFVVANLEVGIGLALFIVK
jgi:hypothetical protein